VSGPRPGKHTNRGQGGRGTILRQAVSQVLKKKKKIKSSLALEKKQVARRNVRKDEGRRKELVQSGGDWGIGSLPPLKGCITFTRVKTEGQENKKEEDWPPLRRRCGRKSFRGVP